MSKKRNSSKKVTSEIVRTGTTPGKYYDTRNTGLFLHIKPLKSGVGRYWLQRLMIGGKSREFGLGTADNLSLSEAREKASENQQRFRAGIDPSTNRLLDEKAILWKKGVPTFEQLARIRHNELIDSWKKGGKHADLWINRLETYCFPKVGHLLVSEITAIQCKEILLHIWQSKPETAKKLKISLNDVFREAVSLGYRDDLPTAALNLPHQRKKSEPRKALHYNDVPATLQRIKDSGRNQIVIACLEFLVLTGVRSIEAVTCAWPDIDIENQVWKIPPEKNKQARAHRVVLTDRCLEILDAMAPFRGSNGTDLVFPATQEGKTLSGNTLMKVHHDLNIPAHIHGYRAAKATFLAENTSEPEEVILQILGHKPRNKVGSLYQRSDYLDRRRPLCQFWTDHCLGKQDDKVVVPFQLRRN